MKRIWHAHPMTRSERRQMQDRWQAELRLVVLERLRAEFARPGPTRRWRVAA